MIKIIENRKSEMSDDFYDHCEFEQIINDFLQKEQSYKFVNMMAHSDGLVAIFVRKNLLIEKNNFNDEKFDLKQNYNFSTYTEKPTLNKNKIIHELEKLILDIKEVL
tara:strand:+ start:229 stop:549 length:321 start_codon:yes stop_codon:yes gene_type:complete